MQWLNFWKQVQEPIDEDEVYEEAENFVSAGYDAAVRNAVREVEALLPEDIDGKTADAILSAIENITNC